MSKRVLELNGQWELLGYSKDESEKIEIKAEVPGHVHLDLLREGLIPDPFWRDQAEECQWVENWNWNYRLEFNVPEGQDKSFAVLEFQGLDTLAEIKLNGKLIGETNNMFIPYHFNVSDILEEGTNNLEVNFLQASKASEGKNLGNYPAAFNTSERVFIRRMQCTFGWDWVGRLVSYGIWKPVKLHFYDKAYINDVFVYTKNLLNDSAELEINIDVEQLSILDGHIAEEHITEGQISGGQVKVEIFDTDENPVWKDTFTYKDKNIKLSAKIEKPKLWWPNGYGQQYLYKCKVSLISMNGSLSGNSNCTSNDHSRDHSNNYLLDQKEVSFGIRTVLLEQKNDEPGSEQEKETNLLRTLYPNMEVGNDDLPGRSFNILINGKRIFCKGGNWVPADPFPSRITKDWYDGLIYTAKEGNINTLRLWGGGTYEKEAFWEACDKYGILVLADFQMACAKYPEDDITFMENLKKEVYSVIPTLRNRPCLVVWFGDNENSMGASEYDLTSWGRKAAEEITGIACKELDPSRPFLPTSPFGGEMNKCLTIGDSHPTAWFPDFLESDGKNYIKLISNKIGRFMSEYAISGAPPINSLLKFMTKEEVYSKDRIMWEYHSKDNPHKKGLTLFQMLEKTAEILFGEDVTPEMRIRHMEYVQYEWLRVGVEAARRKSFYCGGILFWMYNDCWPASGWSIIDYYGEPKAGYFSAKRAFKPVITSIEKGEESYKFWVCNNLHENVSGMLKAFIYSWDTNNILWNKELKFTIDEDCSKVFFELSQEEAGCLLGSSAALFCEINGDFESDRAFYFDGMPYQMKLPETELVISEKPHEAEKSGEITINASNYARVVTLEGDIVFSDNYFDMLAGEQRVIKWNALPKSNNSEIKVYCWNMK